MTYAGLAALIASMTDEQKNSEALIHIPLEPSKLTAVGSLWCIATGQFARRCELPADLGTGFDDDHPVLVVED